MKQVIRYLPDREKRRTEDLWREAFPEDSQAFIDYYYKEKTRDNRILVKEEDGRIVSMLQRNPYRMALGGRTETIDYIVAVATAADSRHRGHMRQLLGRMLKDMYEERQPFTFLMPADEAIYRPFQFAYICGQEKWKEAEAAAGLSRVSVESEADSEAAAAYMERWLSGRYQVYCRRDKAYVRRLLAELASENGRLEALLEHGRLAGLFADWGLEKREQRLLMTDEAFSRPAKDCPPGMMARVAWLPGFLGLFKLREDSAVKSVRLRLAVHDPMIAENCGEFLWTVEKSGASAARLETVGGQGENLVPRLELTADVLVQWLFGYGEGRNLAEKFPDIGVLDRVFIDEVV